MFRYLGYGLLALGLSLGFWLPESAALNVGLALACGSAGAVCLWLDKRRAV